MRNVAQPLRRALRTRAAQGRTVRVAHDGRAALRAGIRHMKRHRALRPLLAHDGEDLGNDLPRLLHEHRVADAQVKVVDEILVMQRGIRDGRAGQTHRLNDRLRREHTRAADLHDDVAHAALLLLRRVFIRHRPARELRRAAEILPLREIVDLNDRAVDVERERLAVVADPVNARAAGIERFTALIRHDREAQRRQIVQRFRVRGKRAVAVKLEVEDDDIELARRRDLRVLLAHRARRRVAGIGQQRLFEQLALGIERCEYFVRHIDLTAHDKLCRRVFKRQRQVAQRAEVFRHVFAGDAVAARSAADEHPVFILERHGQAVDLRLDGIIMRLRERPVHARAERAQLVEREHVLQALERHLMAHLRKGVERVAADVLRRRIGRGVLRVRRLELFEPAHKRVILEIADLGRILHVIEKICVFQLTAQRQDLFAYIHVVYSTSTYVWGTLPTMTVSASRTFVPTVSVWCSQGTRMSRSIFTFRYS